MEDLSVRLSVVTVTFNNLDGLRRTLPSVLRQRAWGSGVEMIVVDGGSTDGTKEYVESLERERPLTFVSGSDAGVFDAQNKGLGLCTGDYVMFLNAGDYLATDDDVDSIQAALRGDPLWVLCSAFDEAQQLEFQHFPPSWWAQVSGRRAYCHQAAVYRTSVLKLLGGHAWRSAGAAADYDLNMRFGAMAEPVPCPDALVVYDGSGFSATEAVQRELPHLMHRARVERLQLTGPPRWASAAWALVVGASRGPLRRARKPWSSSPRVMGRRRPSR